MAEIDLGNKADLVGALSTDGLTVLILVGNATVAGKIHDAAVRAVREPFRKTFWIRDAGILTTQEKLAWGDDGHYRVLDIRKDGDRVSTREVTQGKCDTLVLSNGTVDTITVIGLFSGGI